MRNYATQTKKHQNIFTIKVNSAPSFYCNVILNKCVPLYKWMLLGIVLFFAGLPVSAKEMAPATSVFIDTEIAAQQVLLNGINTHDTSIFSLFIHGRSGELLSNGKWKNAEEIATFPNSVLASLNMYDCEFAKGKKAHKDNTYLTIKLEVSNHEYVKILH